MSQGTEAFIEQRRRRGGDDEWRGRGGPAKSSSIKYDITTVKHLAKTTLPKGFEENVPAKDATHVVKDVKTYNENNDLIGESEEKEDLPVPNVQDIREQMSTRLKTAT